MIKVDWLAANNLLIVGEAALSFFSAVGVQYANYSSQLGASANAEEIYSIILCCPIGSRETFT
jgi:hypothetical protein